jgi:hypothetical protein
LAAIGSPLSCRWKCSKCCTGDDCLGEGRINPGWETLTADDLQGIDVLDEAQYAIEKMRENKRDNDQHIEQNEFEE